MLKWMPYRLLLAGAGVLLSLHGSGEALAIEDNGGKDTITVPAIGLSYTIKEVGASEIFILKRDYLNSVDANSDLKVCFQLLTTEQVAAASPAWLQVQELLRQVDARAKQRADLALLAQRTDLKNAGDLKRLQAESAQFTREIANQVKGWQAALGAMGLTSEETIRVFTGQFDIRGKSDDPYGNLTLWLRDRITQLSQETDTFLKSRDKYRVTVEAFLDPLIGNRKALHVEGYDRLPIGELRPIDRMGLKLTPAEQQRFNMEMQQTKAVAAAITEISDNGKDIRNATRAMLGSLHQQIDELEKEYTSVSDWDVKLTAMAGKIRVSATAEPDTEKRKVLTELADSMDSLVRKKKFVSQRIDELKRLKQQLQSIASGDVTAILQVGALLDQLGSFLANAREIDGFAKELQSIADSVQKLQPAIRQELADLYTVQLEAFTNKLGEEFPKTLAAINIVTGIARGNLQAADATENLAEVKKQLLSRRLDDLPEARIELARSGLVPDDRILVRVKVYEQQANPAEEEKVLNETTVKAIAVLVGWHRVVSPDLIFARALSGDATATKWKPNVAASANWHYTYRDPNGGWEKFVNGVNPGLGFHLASLNQGNESVEFGVGLNLSLFDGLLKGGSGFNLSVSEKPYVFLAIDLLNVLDKAKGVGK